jgi:hypothetical protein
MTNKIKAKFQYQLNLTKKQAELLSLACEVFLRLRLLQLDTALDLAIGDIIWKAAFGSKRLPTSYRQSLHNNLDQIKIDISGLSKNASYGIGCKETGESGNIACDLNQVIRHRLSWDENHKGGNTVNFFEPMRYSLEPLAEIKQIK